MLQNPLPPLVPHRIRCRLAPSPAPIRLPRPLLLVLVLAISITACDREGSIGERSGSAGETEPTCEGSLGCLHLEQVVLLGDADGPGIIEGEAGTASVDSRGWYYVSQEFGQQIKVFSPTGEYQRTIGRHGGGPGEFQAVNLVHAGADDSLHVVDLLGMRWSVFSPDHEYTRSVQLSIPVYMQLQLLPDGRGLFSAPVRGEFARYPLHLLEPNGEHVRSFGAAPDAPAPTGGDAAWRRIAPAGLTSVWAAHMDRYRIELWDAADEGEQPRRVVERTVDWFPPGLQEEVSMEAPPTPRLQGVRQDSSGRLLVLISTADPRWREAIEPGTVHANVTDRSRYRDSRIELIDPETGELLASAAHDIPFYKFIADDLLIASVVDESGIPQVAVWRVSLGGTR